MYPKAISVYPQTNYMLKVQFDNGETRMFDVKPYIRGEWFGELRNPEVFAGVKVEGLSIAWPDGQDIAQDCLFVNSVPLEQ